MQKPDRKNAHKERIFTLLQNKLDFGYQKEHQGKVLMAQKVSLKEEPEAIALLTANKVRESLKGLDGWQLTDDHKMIYREFIVHHFMSAIDMIDRIAVIAEGEKHYPDIHLTQYRNLRVALTTHEVGGLSKKDITVSLKINGLSPNKAIAISAQLKDKGQEGRKKGLVTKAKPKIRKIVSAMLKKKLK